MDEPPPQSLARPSLVAVAAGANADDAAGISILSAVPAPVMPAARQGPEWLHRSLPLLGLAMLLLIAAVFWSEWHQQSAEPASAVALARALQGNPQAIPEPASALPSTEDSVETATIELEAEPRGETPSPGLAALLEPVSVVAKPGKASPRQSTEKAQRSPFTAIEKPAPAGKAPKPSSPPAASSATDVDLLAVLLAHGSTQASVASTPKLTKPSARPKLSTTLSRLEPQPSTQQRLSLCLQMTPAEMSRCKARICAGLWGRDVACPAGGEPPVRGTAG